MSFLSCINRWTLFKSRFFTWLIRKDFKHIGCNSVIKTPFLSYYVKGVSIGDNCHIAAGGWIQAITEYCNVKFDASLEIGDNVYIGRFSHIMACGKMRIGNDVTMGDRVYITDNFHGFSDVGKRIADQPLRLPGDVEIGDGAWIGENCVIMPNVRIGKHAVIGSSSVVTKDIPDYSVAVGTPAKVIKKYNAETGMWDKI